MKGIVITTHKSTQLFYLDLMRSLQGCKYPVVTIFNTDENNQYELAGLKAGMELFEDFVYLHDTVLIKNQLLFDKLFEYKGIVSINPSFLMFLGKYNTKILKQYELPEVRTKKQSWLMELWLGRTFRVPCFDVNFVDGKKFEYIYGRNNMIIENEYLKKMKGTWDEKMIPED